MKRTVLTLLKQAREKFPQSPYLSEKTDNGWLSTTYSQVDNSSDFFALGLLSSLGINKGETIALLSEGRTSWVIAEFGILKAGGIAVPLSVNLLSEEIVFRLNHSQAKAVLVSKHTIQKIGPIWDRIERSDFQIIFLDKDTKILMQLTQRYDINVKKHILLYHDLFEYGQKNYSKEASKLYNKREEIQEEDIVTISYTSGTTGNPKGIMLTHLNYYSNSYDAYHSFQIADHQKTLLILPLDHSFAHTVGIYISLLCALSIYFLDSRQGHIRALKNIPSNLKEVKPDLLLTVPALTKNFMKKIKDEVYKKGPLVWKLFETGLKAGRRIHRDGYRKSPLLVRWANLPVYFICDRMLFTKVREVLGGNLKFCVGGGAYLDPGQQDFFYALNIPVYQGYGLTEASPIISSNCEHTHKIGTAGKLIDNIECSIRHFNGNSVNQGEKGQIWIRGDNVMKGYFKNPKTTWETIQDGWLNTGDIGYLDDDDFLVVVGREKALLISQDGEKYSPEGIEEAIKNVSEFIHQVMIYNDHRKYTIALATLDLWQVQRYAHTYHMHSPEQLLGTIIDSFYSFTKIQTYAQMFPSKWIPVVFRILEEEFSEKNKMINSTMKMVRPTIIETYSQEIEDMYTLSNPSAMNPQNLQVVQKIMQKHA